jgi:hypothetical protein
MSKPKICPLPHSWLVSEWPAEVTPGRPSAGKNLVRTHRSELIACGALVRIGRNLTILGTGYAEFLARKAKRVEGVEGLAGAAQASRLAAHGERVAA